MNQALNPWNILRRLSWRDALLVLGVIVLARLIAFAIRWITLQFAEKVPARLRLPVLSTLPIVRLLIAIGSITIIVPILVEPTFQNVVTLVASVGLTLAFALKDYGSSLIAGLAAVFEKTYQPGDWIEVDGAYGEVKSIGVRAVRLILTLSYHDEFFRHHV